jgi:hypothetical protein
MKGLRPSGPLVLFPFCRFARLFARHLDARLARFGQTNSYRLLAGLNRMLAAFGVVHFFFYVFSSLRGRGFALPPVFSNSFLVLRSGIFNLH